MIRTLNVSERNLWAKPPLVLTLVAGVAQDILPDERFTQYEIAYRYIQNVGGTNPLFYSFGSDCSATNYHGVLQAGQQLDCSNHRMRVSCYSASGTIVATTQLYRADQDIFPNATELVN